MRHQSQTSEISGEVLRLDSRLPCCRHSRPSAEGQRGKTLMLAEKFKEHKKIYTFSYIKCIWKSMLIYVSESLN